MYSLLNSVILGASFVLANVAAVHPNLAAKRIDEAVFVGITYVGPITPGGENYTLVGDAKGIYEQIMQLNPAYNIKDFNLPNLAKDSAKVNRLSERSPTGIICNVESKAAYSRIAEGIAYLNAIGAGGCYSPPKPACGRVSCSYDAAIYFCNDNSFGIAPSCNYLGYGMAQAVLNQCGTCGGSCGVSGQVWDQDNYNVIVGASNNFGEGHC